MAAGDFSAMPNSSVKYYQHLIKRVREHCGTLKSTLAYVGIADNTYRKLIDEDFIVKGVAQKILDAYSKIAPYNLAKNKNAA